MTAKFSFSLLTPQTGDAGLSLKPCACCVLLEATEGTRGSLESGLKAMTGSHQQHLKCPCGQSQSVLCISPVAKRGFWLPSFHGCFFGPAPRISNSRHQARAGCINSVCLTRTWVNHILPPRNCNHWSHTAKQCEKLGMGVEGHAGDFQHPPLGKGREKEI